MAFIRSSLLLASAWIVTTWFFETYRSDLTGDGNWFAIGCLSGIASIHWLLLKKLLAQMQAPEAKCGSDSSAFRASP